MSFSKKNIKEIANIACLEVYENTSDKYILQENLITNEIEERLNNISKLVKKIKNINTDYIKNKINKTINKKQNLRKDKVTIKNKKNIKQKKIQENIKHGLYLVPKKIKNNKDKPYAQ